MNFEKIKVLIIFMLFSLLLGSCIEKNSSVRPSSFHGKPIIYKSDEYVLSKAGKKTSLEQLARIHLGDEKLVWKIEDANALSNLEQDALITVPLKEKHIGGIFENGYQSVPILCYHKFDMEKKSTLTTPRHIFDQQMKYLKDNGYRVISPADLLDFLKYRGQIPKKAVLITIDDGYKSAYDIAWPILKKYGFTATVFVYTSYIGVSPKAMSWDHLRELKTAGFTIGSHTVFHSDLTQKKAGETSDEFYNRVKKELGTSKQMIDRKLNQDTIYLAFPYGRYNSNVLDMAKAAGYKLAVTVDRGTNPFFTNPLALKRDMILKKDMDSFVSKLKTFNNVSLK